MIYANYDPYHLGGKETCKAELQKELGRTSIGNISNP